MKERGILFSGAMVQALLDGRKTMTRRVMNPQPEPIPDDVERVSPGDDSGYWWVCAKVRSAVDLIEAGSLSPYGVPGDRLWVRETWGFDSGVRGDFRPLGRRDLSGMDLLEHTLYRADGHEALRWRPAIHMPRWASRITLEVTEVRVERLQDISEEDARAEGVPLCDEVSGRVSLDDRRGSYRLAFRGLWDSINGKRHGCSWDSNPWLWVVSFKRIDPTPERSTP